MADQVTPFPKSVQLARGTRRYRRKVDQPAARGYDKAEIDRRTCQTCGMLLDDAGEFHPYIFCVLKKAGRDPWQEIRTVALQLGLADPGEKPPLVRELHS